MENRIREVLNEYWGFDTFREKQDDIILSILRGDDVLALLPTGGGKSICFQVPAMVLDGMCLVISPLIALMKDQVSNLRKKNITAYSIVSGMERTEVKKILELAAKDDCKFLYVSPERLHSQLFQDYLQALNISLIAVDEAHCISQWGYDFRPAYLQIASVREVFPQVPMIALTASATPQVQDDICEKLQLQRVKKYTTSFSRPNLSYAVRQSNFKITSLVHILESVRGSAIVYCKSRKNTKDIAGLLLQRNISADFYHAGLSNKERAAKQEEWIKNNIRVMVCTNAFGMGIDKPDVRLVVHFDLPDALEHYYQEAGRAGRDGAKAYAVLLYGPTETNTLLLQPDIKYPSEQDVKTVYKALMNYLQIPADTGEGQYFNFDFLTFIERFGLSVPIAMYGIKALEQDGWIQVNETVWRASKVGFVCTRSYLRSFQEENEGDKRNDLIVAMLRSYEGIFDHNIKINESWLARICKIPETQIVQLLQQLDLASIIQYEKSPDAPQIYFLKDRVVVDEFKLDIIKHEKRKAIYRKRIEAMIGYTLHQQLCRAVIVGRYFGDNTIEDCGVCDTCLSKRKQQPTHITSFDVEEKILDILRTEKQNLHHLVQTMERSYGVETTKTAIRRLESEALIKVTLDGFVTLV